MKTFYFVIVLMSLSPYGFAHDANKAFFKIHQNGAFVEVEAEFPWRIRNAVLEAFPELEYSNNQKDFDAAFFEYISSNFSISNGNKLLSLQSIKELATKGHSHQNNFKLVFIGNNFDSISNTIMFNAYSNQINYHKVFTNTSDLEYTTTAANSSFKINLNSDYESSLGNNSVVILLVVVFGALLAILFFR